MNVLKTVLSVSVVLVILFMLFLSYIGMFAKVAIVEKKSDSMVLVYDEHIGDYKDTRLVQDKIYDILLDKHKIETYKGFAVYYDDPKEVSKDKLRSIAGCVIENKDYDKICLLKDAGLKIKETKSKQSIIVELDIKNNFTPIVGTIKVYPKIKEYVKSKGYQHVEIMDVYDIPNKKIYYIMEIKKQ